MCCLPLFLRLCDDTLKNLRFYAVLPTPKSRLKPSFGVFRCKLLLEICVKIFLQSLGYTGRWKPHDLTFTVSTQDQRVTDGRTDGRMDTPPIAVLCRASKNEYWRTMCVCRTGVPRTEVVLWVNPHDADISSLTCQCYTNCSSSSSNSSISAGSRRREKL